MKNIFLTAFFIFSIINCSVAQSSNIFYLNINPEGFDSWGELIFDHENKPATRKISNSGESEFWSFLQKLLENQANLPQNDVLFFLHGLNGDREPYFSDVVRQMKIHYCDEKKSPVRNLILLTWRTPKHGYRAVSREFAPKIGNHFTEIFKKIGQINRPENARFHFLGNSMAARISSVALKNFSENSVVFSTAVFSAPDLEQNEFLPENFAKFAAEIHFLYNKKDKALQFGSWINGPLLGRFGAKNDQKLPENVFLREVTGVENLTFYGKISNHAYYIFSPTVVEMICGFFRK